MPDHGTAQRPLDVALDILANQYRRRVLVSLLEHSSQDGDTQMPVETTVGDADVETLRVPMVHKHLPKMDDAGFINWDRETDVVGNGPRFEEVRPLLELMDTHSEELPDGWPDC